jgi:hypothetical protein
MDTGAVLQIVHGGAMSKFDTMLGMAHPGERHKINAFATDRDGTVWAFYSREPRPAYQVWVSDQHSFVVGYGGPMLDDWDHSLIQRSQRSALKVGCILALFCSAAASLWWMGLA